MIFRILKNDLKRKKTMNIILFLFIVLASCFTASGINNVITVMNGTDYYLDQANVGDYVVITMGDDAIGNLEPILKKEDEIKDYRIENVIYGSQDDIRDANGKKLKCKNTTIYQSIDDSAITFFHEDNSEVKMIQKGHIYVSSAFKENNHLQEGDILYIEHSGTKLKFIFDGIIKDALLGSDFMGNTRFLLNDEDMDLLLENKKINKHYQGEICYIDTDDVSALSSTMTKLSNVTFSGTRSLIKMCYVMEMIVAFIMLILSVCLIIVSFAVLKFSITFTIGEEFREIGVMKAIGLSQTKIRSLYIIKYLVMSIVGAFVGFLISIPFGNMLLDAVSKKMVLGNDGGIWFSSLGALFVVCIIVLFAYLCTSKVKKYYPVDAIRNAQSNEQFKRKSVLRMQSFPMGNTIFMAINDILSAPKRFITIMLSFGICTLFVLLMVNTTATIKSPNLIHTFGTKTDLYMTDVSTVMKSMGAETKEDMFNRLHQMEKELKQNNMPSRCCIEIQYKYPFTFKGKDFVLTCQQGLNTKISDYVFMKGSMPSNANEIAITPQISEMTGAKIGDVLTMHNGKEDVDYIVSAYIQTMNNLGELIRLHEDVPTDFKYISSMMHFQIDFLDDISEEEIENRKERIKELYHNDKVMNTTEYCIDCTGVADTLESVQFLLLAITLIVVVLVTILMERSFIANEKSQIAILKAIGFSDQKVIKWHIYRFGIVTFISVMLAALLSIPMTSLCITPIFRMMGATSIDFNIVVINVFLIYPGIVLLMTMVMVWMSALYTKTIKSSDTANIE